MKGRQRVGGGYSESVGGTDSHQLDVDDGGLGLL